MNTRLSVIAIVLVLAVNALPIPQSDSSKTAATEAFNRFKKLAGKWQGRSTKGWQETVVFHTIAGESVVVEDLHLLFSTARIYRRAIADTWTKR
jgi:hypothetical protein